MVFAFLSFSQFISLTVLPKAIPRICVWTAPETPTVHKSEFDEPIPGAIAVGGGEITVVSEVELLLTLLSVVDSVTIVCATEAEAANIEVKIIAKILFIILFRS
jgi:hypothetical protein